MNERYIACPECGDYTRHDHVHDCRPPKTVVLLRTRIAHMEGLLREAVAVLGLLRLHRTSPHTWDQQIPSDLLSREDAALAAPEAPEER